MGRKGTRSALDRVIAGRGVLVVPAVLALATRLAYWVVLTPHWEPASDALQYTRLARFVAQGRGYSEIYPGLEMHPTAFRPPLYPLLLSVPARTFDTDALWPLRLTTLLLGVAVAVLAALYARRLAGPVAGLAAGAAVALCPSLVAGDTVTLTEPLALVLLLGVLLALTRDRAVWAGAWCGLLLLTRPNAYLVVVVVVVALWRSVGWKRAALSALVVAAVVAPWIVRNQVQVGTPRLTTSEGFNLAAIYGPEAQRRGGFVDPTMDPAYDGSELEVLQLDEAAWNDALTRLGLESLGENPGYVARNAGSNGLRLFELRPSWNEPAEALDGRHLGFRRLTLPLFHALLVTGVVGLWLRRRDPATWPALATVGQFVALSLVMISVPRLRAPLDLLLCIGVGFVVAEVAARRRPSPVIDLPEPTVDLAAAPVGADLRVPDRTVGHPDA